MRTQRYAVRPIGDQRRTASLEDLRARRRKVDYFQKKYAPMRRGIVPHPAYIDESNVEKVRGFAFVFLCMYGRPGKEAVARYRVAHGLKFAGGRRRPRRHTRIVKFPFRPAHVGPRQLGRKADGGSLPRRDAVSADRKTA